MMKLCKSTNIDHETHLKATREQSSGISIRPSSCDDCDADFQEDCVDQIMPIPSAGVSEQRRRGSTDSVPGAYISSAEGEEMRAREKISFSLLGSSTASTDAPDLSLLSLGLPTDDHHEDPFHSESQDVAHIPTRKSSQQQDCNDVEGGLVVASMVLDESAPKITCMAEAEELDLTAKSENKTTLTRKKLAGLCFVCVSVIVIVVAVAGSIMYASTRKDETSVQPTSNNNSSSSTMEADDIDPNIPSMESRVKSLLPQYTLDTLRNNDVDSPQARAYQWIMEDPSLELYTNDRILQRFALSTFFFAMDGHNWTTNTHWLSYQHHECEWFATDMRIVSQSGVLGNQAKKAASPYLDESPPCGVGGGDDDSANEGTYAHLWLFQNGLNGQLPPEMYLLTSLQTIFFGMDQLVGSTISSLIGNLPSLNVLFMVATDVGGTIPAQISRLDNLETLYLFKNEISGSIPTELGLLSNSLEYLDLGENSRLTGTLPTQFGQLEKLRNLMLWIGQLSGTLPKELGNMQALTSLNIGWNKLEGGIPTELGSNSLLRKIFLDKNQLTGSLPSELALLQSLEELWLHGNELSGSIPSELADIKNGSLVALNLEGNPITGTIPTDLCHIGEGTDSCSLAAVFGCDLGFDCSGSLCGCDCSCPGGV